MRADNGKEKKGFSTKDIVMIVLCIIALAALVLILQKSKKSEEQQQQQLSEISEQIQQEGITSTGVDKTPYAELLINEVNQEGWIELYNSSKKDIALRGFSLEVDGEQQQLPQEIQVPACGLVVLEAGKALGETEHTVLSLVSGEGEKICSLTVPALLEKESYGCTQDGTPEKSYQKASKGDPNQEENVILKEGLSFSIPGGFYTDAISLEITAPEGTKVYYTLDGSTPTTESSLYQEAISIANRSGSNYQYVSLAMSDYVPSSIYMGTVVRAIAVDDSGNIIQDETESYFIGLGKNSDLYDMPVISVTTDPVNLFDYFEGIYVPGRSKEDAIVMNSEAGNAGNYWNLWSKEAHIEYFENNKAKTYEGSVNLSILQDYSIENRQKGFKATGTEEGAWKGSGLYEYFNEGSKTLLLQTNKRDNVSKLREYLANELLSTTEVGTSSAKPCIVFIDGEYWGAYMLHEVFDETYVKRQYGLDDDTKVLIEKNDVFNNWDHHALYDEFYEFVTSNDMSIQENYDQVNKMMDVQSYLDYFCANVYLANADYGSEEGCMWRTISVGDGYADGRWRWSVGKLDNAMNNSIESKRTTATIDTYKMPEIAQDEIFVSLFRNAEFRSQLEITMKKMADEIFEYSRVETAINTISARNEKMILSSYERFYGQNADNVYKKELEDIKSFFADRAEYILLYTEEIMNMEGQWYQYIESMEEDIEADDQETVTEQDGQGSAETGVNGVS